MAPSRSEVISSDLCSQGRLQSAFVATLSFGGFQTLVIGSLRLNRKMLPMPSRPNWPTSNVTHEVVLNCVVKARYRAIQMNGWSEGGRISSQRITTVSQPPIHPKLQRRTTFSIDGRACPWWTRYFASFSSVEKPRSCRKMGVDWTYSA